jgi:hypothetical protein
MRWHHITGLVFGVMMICWIFSGLMSMNPLGIFSPQGPRPDLRAYQHTGPGSNPFRLTTHEALTLLGAEGLTRARSNGKYWMGSPTCWPSMEWGRPASCPQTLLHRR